MAKLPEASEHSTRIVSITCKRCGILVNRKWGRGWQTALYCDNCRKKVRIEKDRKVYQKYRAARIAARHQYYESNKQQVIDSNRNWRNRNPERVKLLRHQRDERLRRAFKDGSITTESVRELLIFQEKRCNGCGIDMGNSWTIDHIIPLAKDGQHVIANIQLLCFSCNSRKQDRMLEKDVQYTILQYLRLKGYFVWKNSVSGIKKSDGGYIPSQSKGSADILGIAKDGKFLAVEVKKPSMSYKPTPAQIDFLTAIKKNGGYAGIATSIEDVDRILKGETPGL